jgi:hypothetical protein
VSTYLVPVDEIERVLMTLVAHMVAARVDAIVLELADGVLQPETAALLVSPTFRELVGGILFAACDAMGAVAGHAWLRSHGLPIIALSGVVSASPLQCDESTRETGLPVHSRQHLARPRTAMQILTNCEARTTRVDHQSKPA